MYRIRFLRISILAYLAVLVVISLAINIPKVAALLPRASIYSCDEWGFEKNTFGLGEIVYASGDNYDQLESVTIYVTRNGGPYVSIHSLCGKAAQADSSGHLEPVDLGTFDLGEYDIWVDRGPMQNGWIHYPEEPADTFGCARGFLVIPEFWLGTVLGLVGCFAAFGVFRVSKRRHK